MIKHIFKKEWFNPLFYYILHYLKDNDIREIYVYGGSSSAKTHSILQALMIDGYYRNYSTLVYRKEQTAIKTTVKNECKAIIENLNLTQYQEFDFEFRYNEQKLQFKGIDKEGKIKGLKGFRKLFFDEIDQFKVEEFNQAKLRLRGEENQQLLFSWNPISSKHWLKGYLDTFEWENVDLGFSDAHKHLDENSFIKHHKNKILIKTTYLDNRWVVGGDWGRYDEHVINEFETLKLTNSNLYNVYALGNWGQTLNKNPFFYAFNRSTSYRPDIQIDFESGYIDLSFDFNKSPTTLICGQMQKHGFVIFDVILADNKTYSEKSALESVCMLFKNKYPQIEPYRMRVTGDASGRNGSSDKAINVNFYTTIKKELKVVDANLDKYVRSANLPHTLSGDIINHFFINVPIYFTYNCLILVDEIEMAEIDDKGTLNAWKNDTQKSGGGHMVDAFRYLITDLWVNTSPKEWRTKIDQLKLQYESRPL